MSEKCTLVIESSPFVTRWALSAGSGGRIGETIYDLVGYRSPGYTKGGEREFSWARLGEQYEWYAGEDVSAGRHSKMETPETLWRSLLREGVDADRRGGASELVQALIPEITGSEAFRKFTEDDGLAVEAVVFLVPEYLDGSGQEHLHRTLVRACRGLRIGEVNTFLLFRSAALALAHIVESKSREGQGLLVLDCGHYWYEASRLDVVEKGGTLVPRRSFRAAKGLGNRSPETLGEVLRQGYGIDRAAPCGTEQIKLHQVVHEGLELPDLLEFDEERLCYRTLSPSNGDRQIPAVTGLAEHISRFQESDHGSRQQQTYRSMLEYLEDRAADVGLLHGWPVALGDSGGLPFCAGESAVLGGDAALRGGMEFAKRLRARKPTYLESIPRFEIYRHVKAKFDDKVPLVDSRDMDGAGRREREENTSFHILKGRDFQCGIRVLDEVADGEARCVEVPGPEEQVDITIAAEIRPMAGGVRFTIKPQDPTSSAFEPVRMNWDAASPFVPPRYAYPDTIKYPGDDGKRGALRHLVGAVDSPEFGALRSGVYAPVIRGNFGDIRKLLHPLKSNSYVVAFGGGYVELDSQLEGFVRELNDIAADVLRRGSMRRMDWNMVELAGDTFVHAHEGFREAMALRVVTGRALEESTKACWAFGRSCNRADWMERFVGRFLAEEERDSFDGRRYQIIWPFQKSLALYPDVAGISASAGYKMVGYLMDTLRDLATGTFPVQDFKTGNDRMWALSAILFALRIRVHHPDFLDPGSEDPQTRARALELRGLVQATRVPVPPLALKGSDFGEEYEGADGFTRIVVRFIDKEATAEDVEIVGIDRS